MAEAIAVVTLVATIATLVDLSAKLISRLQEFVSHTSDVPKSFRSLADQLPLLSQTLQRIQTRAQAGHVQVSFARDLDTLLNGILDQVDFLQECLDQVAFSSSASRLDRVLLGLRSLAKDEKVKQALEKVYNGINVLVLYQTTNNVDIGDRILSELAQLKVQSPSPSLSVALGLCLGQAPQIEHDAFIGRESELSQLAAWLSPQVNGNLQKVVSIVGMGGLGKTQLSLAYARANENRYTSVFWVSAKTELGLQQNTDVRRLAVRLDGLPLALATAGVYLGQRANVSCGEYLEAYETMWTELYGPDSEELLEYDNRTLSSTWAISLDQVRRLDADAAELFQFLAHFNNKDMWYELIRAGADGGPAWLKRVTTNKVRFDRTMVKLHDYSLVEIQAGSYVIHPCIHDWLSENSHIDHASFKSAIQCIAHSVPDESHAQYWKLTRRLLLHAEKIGKGILRIPWESYISDELLLENSHTLAVLLLDWNQLNAAEAMLLHVLAAKEQALGQDHASTLQSVQRLGMAYGEQSRFVEAESMFLRALSSQEIALGRDDISTLITVGCLGRVYRLQNRLEEAEEMFLRTLAGYERTQGRESKFTLHAVSRLASLYGDQGRSDQAEAMYLRALSGYEQLLGKHHDSTLNTVHNLGTFYRRQDKEEQAEEWYLRALQGCEQALGRDHFSTLLTVYDLGTLHASQGKLETAEEELTRVITDYQGDDAAKRWQGGLQQLVHILCENTRVKMSSGDTQAAKTEVARLILHAENWDAEDAIMIDGVAKALIIVEDDEEARLAYLHSAELKKDNTVDDEFVSCDGCRYKVTLDSGRHVCRVCNDNDLCNECMFKYSSKDLAVQNCVGHAYFDAGSAVSSILNSPEVLARMDRVAWMERLKEKYPVVANT